MFSGAIGAAISILVGQPIAAHHLGHVTRCLIQRDSGDCKVGRVNHSRDLATDEHNHRHQRNRALAASVA